MVRVVTTAKRFISQVCIPLQRFVNRGYRRNCTSASDQRKRAIHPFTIKVTSWQLNVPAVWSRLTAPSIKLFTRSPDVFLWVSPSPSQKKLTFSKAYQTAEIHRPYLVLEHCFVWSPRWLTCFMSTTYHGCFEFNDKALIAVQSCRINESGSKMWSVSRVYLQVLILMKPATHMVLSGWPHYPVTSSVS